MACTSCEQQKTILNDNRFNTVKRKANDQAKSVGIKAYAILKTVNDNPGYMWRTIDNPDCQRLEVIGYYTVD